MTSPTTRVRALSLLAVGATVLALAGCGDDPDDTEGTAADPTTSETAPADEVSEPVVPGNRRSENIVLEQPEEGATVSGSFTASGEANSPEANVLWEVRDAETGDVVADGFATAEGWMDKLYPWETEVDVSGLEPGPYRFVAMTDDPSGGEGKPAEEVSANIVVE